MAQRWAFPRWLGWTRCLLSPWGQWHAQEGLWYLVLCLAAIPSHPPLLSSPSSDLQLRLETVTAESQEKVDAQAATIAKLNKALRTKVEVSQKWASAHPRAEPNWDGC